MKSGIYKKNLLVPSLKILADIASVELAVLFSYYVRFYSPLTKIFPVRDGYYPPLVHYFYFSIIISLIFIGLFSAAHSYRSRFFSSFSQEIGLIFKTSFIAVLLSMSVAFLYRSFSYSRLVFVLIFFNAVLFLLIERFIFHKLKKRLLERGFNRLRIYLAGSAENISRVYPKLDSDENFNIELAGYVCQHPIDNFPLEYIGDLNSVPRIIKENDFDGFFITFNQSEHPRILEIMKATEGTNIEMFYVPDILDILTSHFNNLEIGGIPVLQLKAFTLSGWQGFIKRGFDIVVSFLALILLSPLFLLIAALIKITSQGPVFYRQNRITLEFREFTMLKFRSMYVTEESKSGLVDVVKNDPRVTPLGRFLRRSSLDELPQLINVLKGEMSLVGPRPERRYYVEQNMKLIPRYSERHWVRCGITGWAQVNGLRQQNT
ncbi:MAG: sugar transferase, partial [Calditrichia bacterium]